MHINSTTINWVNDGLTATYWNKILHNVHVWQRVDLDCFIEVRINTATSRTVINDIIFISQVISDQMRSVV